MILQHLKTRTATLHKETEADNLAKYILDHSITLDQYKALLSQNYQAYYTLSELSKQFSGPMPESLRVFADSKKAEALEKDLKQLGASLPSKLNESLPNEINYPFLLGMLYVAEGSMMGGLLIRKNLENCEGINTIETHHFFGKSAPDVMNRWKAFTEAVNEKTYTDSEIDEAVDGAYFAFEIFQKAY